MEDTLASQTNLLYAAAAIGGVGIAYLLGKRNKLAAAAQNIRNQEEQKAKQAASGLLATSFYSDLESLRKGLDGQVILPTDGEVYHECRRRAFNQDQRGFPLVIVRVKSVNDVVKCIKFATGHRSEINLCVACGGHSSKCMMTGSFVIDMFHMNKAQLDKEKLFVTVEGGAYLEEIDKVLKPHNLGVTVGTYPQTGVGGLVLGGGFGFLGRMFGWSVDNLVECEIVLPTGEVVIANDTSPYSDLIWGLRGGSGNFGVVTKFKFRVHKLPSQCMGGLIVKLTPSLESAIQVVENFDRIGGTLPDNMGSACVLPGGASVTPTLWTYFGEAKSVKDVPQLQEASTKLGGFFTLQNNVRPMSYHTDLQTITTPQTTSGHLYHTLIQFGELGKPLPRELWESLLRFTRQTMHPSLKKASLLIMQMGAQLGAKDPDGTQTCLTRSIRHARYFGIIEAYWNPEFGEKGKDAAREWARTVNGLIKPHSNEALRYAAADNSVNSADVIDELYKDQAGYGMDKYPKLRQLKKKYDPTNLFKNNVNIAPA